MNNLAIAVQTYDDVEPFTSLAVNSHVQQEIVSLAKLLSGLKPFATKVEETQNGKAFLADLNLTVEVNKELYEQACKSQDINPRWFEKKYADKYKTRSLFTKTSTLLYVSAMDTHDEDAYLKQIKGAFGLAVSFGIFGQASLAELERRSGDHELAEVHEAAALIKEERAICTRRFLSETKKAINLAGEKFDSRLRNALRDIVFFAADREIEHFSSSPMTASEIKKIANSILQEIGFKNIFAA